MQNVHAGTIPAGLASAALNSLQLDNNRLTGTLPSMWGGDMPALQNLTLQSNQLTGRLSQCSSLCGRPLLIVLLPYRHPTSCLGRLWRHAAAAGERAGMLG